METAQLKKPDKQLIRPFKGNNIRLLIDAAVVRERDESLRDKYRAAITGELGITKRFSQMLNNILQPTLEEASTIAQILGVQVDELCELAPEVE